MEKEVKRLTYGQKLVGAKLDADPEDYVNNVRMAAAEAIDAVDKSAPGNKWPEEKRIEFNRLKQEAIKCYEMGLMWADRMSIM